MGVTYNYRSLHLDCARHFFSVETVKKVIKGISYGNLNILHWHLTDDHAWRIESKKFPKLHESSGQYYTQEQIREIIDYAKERGIEVIPEIDMPGHNLALLSVFPQYSCKGEPVTPARARGVYKTILCAGKEETYAFMEELLDEMIPLKKVYDFQPHLYKYMVQRMDQMLGFEACTWTEHIDNEQKLCEHIFPRVFALAERANGEEYTDYESFKNRVREKTKLLDKAGIPYTKENWWDPKGKARREDAIRFYFNMSAGVDEEEAKKQAASAAPKLEFVLHFIKEFYRLGDIPTFIYKLIRK